MSNNQPEIILEPQDEGFGLLHGTSEDEDPYAALEAFYGTKEEVAEPAQTRVGVGTPGLAKVILSSKAKKVAYIAWIETVERQKGVARGMLEKALDKLEKAGVKEVFLVAVPDTKKISFSDLTRFYRSVGFQHWREDPAIMMVKLPWKRVEQEDALENPSAIEYFAEPYQSEHARVIAEANGKKIGELYLGNEYILNSDDQPNYKVDSLNVDPAWRRHGVATKLFEKAVEYARKEGKSVFSVEGHRSAFAELLHGKLRRKLKHTSIEDDGWGHMDVYSNPPALRHIRDGGEGQAMCGLKLPKHLEYQYDPYAHLPACEACDRAVGARQKSVHREWLEGQAPKRQRRSAQNSAGAMPEGFDGALFDEGFNEDFGVPAKLFKEPVLGRVKRDDIVKVGKTQWLVFRAFGPGAIQPWAYKHPSMHQKAYTMMLAATDGSPDVVVYETGGSGQRVGPDLVRGEPEII